MKWRITALAAGAAAAAATIGFAGEASAATAPCSAAAKACVQLHTGTAWLVDHGSVLRGGVPITAGKPAFPTPSGTFRVQYKDIDHYSKQFNGPMPYSVFFTTTGVAFHQGSLKVQSHGCVHLSHADAVAFYNSLHPGDVVEVVK
ncbi:L,D-transpeptidase [Amycolatopsis sp. FDAARGOS 1241]|uniref:L,D-transpeptidase n=1 Tax=Amycolatopsis sp. FDAARGOS 1241 TaxID=2778070 RepID=UPI001950DD59|nr:L,D-transpeptidase [Amycolatopsis sp. FDAARGOS 1241]QRP49793.1 L,D-transpeptidase [Amycolatopsis sp. FDAARGOS 1241]